jgi:hypothetical protein
MSLNKTWLPYHRKLYSRDLPVCKTKTKFHKYIPIQKEQIVPVYIQKQKTRMRHCIFFTILIAKSIQCLRQKKGAEYSFQIKSLRKGSWVRYFGICECENSPQSSIACMPHMSDLSCPRVLRKDLHSKPTLYPQSWVFLMLIFWRTLLFSVARDLSVVRDL